MATSGAKFLKLTKAAVSTVSGHARARSKECAGFVVTEGLAGAQYRVADWATPDGAAA